jgi:hypothetical protein
MSIYNTVTLCALALFLSAPVVAKHDPAEYATQLVFRTRSNWMNGSPSADALALRSSIDHHWRCYSVVTADDHVYAIASENTGCSNMTQGAHGLFRLGSTWGARWFAITWTDGKGAVHHDKYNIVEDIFLGK